MQYEFLITFFQPGFRHSKNPFPRETKNGRGRLQQRYPDWSNSWRRYENRDRLYRPREMMQLGRRRLGERGIVS